MTAGDLIEEHGEELARLSDRYDDCIVGLVSRFGQDTCIAYDQDMILELLRADGMTGDEAVEFFHYNILGAWEGETTPCFIALP